ncbi:yfmR [Scenedesmus sp. PABB004]|nr:yfmR [Scenedesmus sp. PABB004]
MRAQAAPPRAAQPGTPRSASSAAGLGLLPLRRARPAPAARRGGAVLPRAKRGDVLVVLEGVRKTHDGEKVLFSNCTFTLAAGDRLAVVGPNGAGKSTLLRIITGAADHDGGTISRNKGAKVGFLPQGDMLLRDGAAPGGADLESMSVLAAVLASDSAMARAVQAYQRALADAGGAVTPALEAAIEAMDTHNAWEVDGEARRILSAVGLPDANAPVAGLSGGQRRRLALAAALLGGPDLLVLDEPTNHMDVEAIEWLASEVRGAADLAVVMVSHDRAFMEDVCDRLLELDHGGFTACHEFGGPGSYTRFKAARAARRHAQANAAADARTLLRRESEWMARQPKARSTKAKARVDAYAGLQAAARDRPPDDLRVDFGSVAMARLGNKAVLLEGVSYATPAGRPLLADVTAELLPGERIGIAGPNGVGKSTLLDIVAGVKEPQSGRRELGETAVVGYFQQQPPRVEPGLRLVDYIREVGEKRKARAGESGLVGPPESPETLLERLGFPRKIQYQKVESLSGGERRRLHLAAVLASAPNVLLLDEPTNDLDLNTVEVLEEMLQSYRGLLLVVSHDRAFMSGATDRLLVLPGDGSVQRAQGGYGDYLAQLFASRAGAAAAAAEAQKRARAQSQAGRAGGNGGSGSSASNGKGGGGGSGGSGASKGAATATAPAAAAVAAAPAAKPASKRKLGLFEQQEYKRLGEEMASLEAAQAAANERLISLTSGGGGDVAAIEAASLALAELQASYEAKEERWFELAEIAGDI